MKNSPSRTAASERGFVLLPIFGIIAILIGLLLPAVNAAREAGRLLQEYESTAELGAEIVAEADATEALGRNLARALDDFGENGFVPVIIQLPELRARIASVKALRTRVSAQASEHQQDASISGFIADPIVGLLGRADDALGRMLALLRSTEQSLFSHADEQRN